MLEFLFNSVGEFGLSPAAIIFCLVVVWYVLHNSSKQQRRIDHITDDAFKDVEKLRVEVATLQASYIETSLQLGAIQGDNIALRSEVERLKLELAQVKSERDELKRRLSDRETRIAKLERRVEELEHGTGEHRKV